MICVDGFSDDDEEDTVFSTFLNSYPDSCLKIWKKIYCISQGLSKAPRSASWRQAQDLLRGLFQDSQAPSATPREVPAVGSHQGFSEDVQGYSNPLHVQITAITTIVYLVYIYSNNSNHLLLPICTLQTYLACWAQL